MKACRTAVSIRVISLAMFIALAWSGKQSLAFQPPGKKTTATRENHSHDRHNEKRVVVIGAGTAGISIAAQLLRKNKTHPPTERIAVTVIDPAQTHYYQPDATFVGAGIVKKHHTAKPTRKVVPNDATWIPQAVQTIDPQKKRVVLADKGTVDYDYLVVATGIQPNLNAVPGLVEVPYEIMHVAPPHAAPQWLKSVPELADSRGFLDVIPTSLQHKVYPEIFGAGDVTNATEARTAAGIRKQAPVATDNILRLIAGRDADNHSYEGFSCCPFPVWRTGLLGQKIRQVILAMFDNKGAAKDPVLSKVIDTTKAHWANWVLKRYFLPFLYWNRMLKGKEF